MGLRRACLTSLASALACLAATAGPARADLTFTPPLGQSYIFAASSQPIDVALGDLNADGVTDALTSLNGGSAVALLLGTGTGAFTVGSAPAGVGPTPWDVVIDDLSGDGRTDFAVVEEAAGGVRVFLSFTGGFANLGITATSPADTALTAGDFNNDGLTDLATTGATTDTVTILLGSVGGAFTEPSGSPIAVGTDPLDIGSGDLDGDGDDDLVVPNVNGASVSVLLSNGTGQFSAAPGSPVTVPVGPWAVAVADLNGDAIPDIATANTASSGRVHVLLGIGTGGFAPAPGSPYVNGSQPRDIAIGDFNGDGRPDLVTSHESGQNFRVLLGDGTGAFAAAPGSPFSTGSNAYGIAASDLDGNGLDDVVVAVPAPNAVAVFRNVTAAAAHSRPARSPSAARSRPARRRRRCRS